MLRVRWGVTVSGLGACALLAGFALAAVGGQAAAANGALVTLDSAKPALAADDPGWTVDVSLTNLTQDELTVTAAETAKHVQGCDLEVSTGSPLPAAQPGIVTVTVPHACSAVDGFGIKLTATDSSGANPVSQSVAVEASKPPTDVNWAPLNAFWISLVAGLVLAGVGFGWLCCEKHGGQGLLGRLPYLEASWTFKDSWLTNVTAGAGLLTGIIGTSGVAKALVGADADDKLRLATVAAAIAAALIAASPLVLGALAGTDDGQPTIAGLFVAGAVSLSAASGLLWALGSSAGLLGVPWLSQHNHGLWLAVAGIALTLWYGVTSMASTVRSGLHEPDPAKPSDVTLAAELVSGAIIARIPVLADDKASLRQLQDGLAKVQELYARLTEEKPHAAPAPEAAVPDEPRKIAASPKVRRVAGTPRRRSALL